MNYETLEEGMAIKSGDKIYLVVAVDFKIRNPLKQSITLYDTELNRLVYPSILDMMHRNKLWHYAEEIQEIFSKDQVSISIV